VYKKEYTPEIVSKIIEEKKLNGLRVFSVLKNDRLESISFLKDYTFLEQLDITGVTDFEFSFLQELTNLKRLSISIEGKNEIDLSELRNLEYLSIQWRSKIKGLENCVNLNHLCLIDFKENDLTKIASLSKLKELRIKTSSIQTLNGLNNLKELELVSIGNCKKLASISSIDSLLHLKYLEFNICPKIKIFSSLNNLPNLETLILSDCNKIDSIEFIKKFPLLSSLGLLGNTDIIDSNLLPAKNLKSVTYKHRSHYNIKISNKEDEDRIKNNMEKLKNIMK
jgi:hypothetical protein